MDTKQLITSWLYNVYMLTWMKSQEALDAMYESKGVDAQDRLSINEIKSMKFGQFLESKANEAMSTTQAGFGGNFVNSEVLVNAILDSVRDAETLLSYIPNQRTMLNPIEAIPVEWADFDMEYLAENADVPWATRLKKAWTEKITLTAQQFVATVYFTQELLEDSVSNIMTYVERKLLQSFVTTIHNVIINGDKDNDINGTTWANSALRRVNGLRKYAIDDSRVINAWAMDLWDIRDARKLLGIKWVNPSDLIMLCDYGSYNNLLGLTPVETMEKFGTSATVVNGTITAIDGIQVLPRAEVFATLATGIKSDTPASNVAGQIIIVHKPSMYLGWKRALQVENDYDVTTLQYFFTGSTRMDFVLNEKDAPAVALITNTL